MPHDHHYVLRLKTTVSALPALAELLGPLGTRSASVIHPELAQAILSIYFDTPTEAEREQAVVDAALPEWRRLLAAPIDLLGIDTLAQEDWAETWKRFFHPRRVTDRLVVAPSWEPYQPAPDEIVLEIDPGMSFGTGQHATTVACLAALERLAANGHTGAVLDVGCGSGILALAAAKLGFAPILAFDADPQAVVSAEENLQRARVADRVKLFQANLGDFQPPHPFPIVLANLEATILLAFSDRLVACLANDQPAWLAIAGILTSQYEGVLAAFAERGLVEHSCTTSGEWTSGLLHRQAASSGPAGASLS